MRRLGHGAIALILVATVGVATGGSTASAFVPLAVTATIQEVHADPAQVSSVKDLSCPTASLCVLAASPSVRTTDGGSTWTPFALPLTGDFGLSSVYCLSATTCLGTDAFSTVVKSVDGGATWTNVTDRTSGVQINDLDCYSPTACVGVGAIGVGAAGVWTSADTGSTWTTRTAAVTSELKSVACASASLCVAVGSGAVMSSTNGGATWVQPTVPDAPNFFAQVTCVAPSTCVYTSLTTVDVTNDGSTWTSMPLPQGVSELEAIGCSSAHVCAATSSNGLREVFDPTTHAFQNTIPSFGLIREVKIECRGQSCFSAGDAFVDHSTDGGVSWARVRTFPGAGRVVDVDCVDGLHCVAVGLQLSPPAATATEVLLSADAGATWQATATPPADLPLGLNEVVCVPGTTRCVTAGLADLTTFRVGLDVSPDGGATWQTATSDVPLGAVTDVACFAGGKCLALGADVSTPSAPVRPLVLRSADGGATWQSSEVSALPVQRLACQSATTCMLMATQNLFGPMALLRTVDGGATWSSANPPIPNVDGMRFLGCTATGCVGTFDSPTQVVGRVTTDAGLTWSVPSVFTQPNADGPLPVCGAALCLDSPSFNDHAEVRTWTGTGSWDVVATSPAIRMRHLICPQPTVCLAMATSGVTFGSALERIVINTTPVGTVTGVPPARLLETRVGPGFETVDHLFQGTGALAAGSTLVLQVAGRGGVAANATSAMLNVTVAQASKPGFVTVYPCDQGQPVASNVNFVKGSTVANGVLAKLAANGTVCVFTQQTTHMVVDVGAFVPNDSASIIGVAPARLMETRKGPGLMTVDHLYEGTGVVLSGVSVLQVAGRGGVPSGAKAAVLNVTATQALGPGFLTVYPCDKPRPVASNVNYVAGQTVPNTVYATLDAFGYICIYSLAPTHVIVDVDAYAPGSGSYLQPLVPARLLETRPGLPTVDGLFGGSGPLGVRTPFVLQVGGRGGVPVGASTAMLNVTVTEPSDGGFVTVYPCDQPVPLASNVNFDAGATVANAVVAKLAANGTVCVYSSASTQVLVDVNAYIP